MIVQIFGFYLPILPFWFAKKMILCAFLCGFSRSVFQFTSPKNASQAGAA
jgi:hypothetical protein